MKYPKFNKPSIPIYIFVSIGVWLLYNYFYRDCFNKALTDIAGISFVLGIMLIITSGVGDAYDRYVCKRPKARRKFLHIFFSTFLNAFSLMLFLILIVASVLVGVEFLILSIFGCYDLELILSKLCF